VFEGLEPYDPNLEIVQRGAKAIKLVLVLRDDNTPMQYPRQHILEISLENHQPIGADPVQNSKNRPMRR
jgi:hypothetical protein